MVGTRLPPSQVSPAAGRIRSYDPSLTPQPIARCVGRLPGVCLCVGRAAIARPSAAVLSIRGDVQDDACFRLRRGTYSWHVFFRMAVGSARRVVGDHRSDRCGLLDARCRRTMAVVLATLQDLAPLPLVHIQFGGVPRRANNGKRRRPPVAHLPAKRIEKKARGPLSPGLKVCPSRKLPGAAAPSAGHAAQKAFQMLAAHRVLQFADGFGFDLPDAFARDLEDPARPLRACRCSRLPGRNAGE